MTFSKAHPLSLAISIACFPTVVFATASSDSDEVVQVYGHAYQAMLNMPHNLERKRMSHGLTFLSLCR